MELPESLENYSEFVRGQEDARKGVKHESQGEYYNRGYAHEYELQEMISGRAK